MARTYKDNKYNDWAGGKDAQKRRKLKKQARKAERRAEQSENDDERPFDPFMTFDDANWSRD